MKHFLSLAAQIDPEVGGYLEVAELLFVLSSTVEEGVGGHLEVLLDSGQDMLSMVLELVPLSIFSLQHAG